MTYRFGKWPKDLGNGLYTLDTALVFQKRLYYVGSGFTMLEMVKNLTNGLNMWEMTYIYGKWLKYLRNG